MRFSNFPLELKRKIMSYIPCKDQCKKIASVSKEWDELLHDSFNWKEVKFCSFEEDICCEGNFSLPKCPDKLTFWYYFVDYYDDFPVFPVLNSVKEIIFDNCNFPDSAFIQLLVDYFPNIRKLTINKDPRYVDDPGLTHAPSENWMEGLVDGGIEHLNQWRNLKTVELRAIYRTQFNEIASGIAELDHHLRELILSRSECVEDSTLKTIAKHQGRYLEKFSMYFNSITRDVYRELTYFENLRELTIFFPRQMTDREFVLVIQELKNLRFLRVEYSDTLFSKEFATLMKDTTLPGIVELILGHCSECTNDDLTLFFNFLPLLKRLTLRNLDKITNQGLQSLPVVSSNLKILHLEFMRNVTKKCLLNISRDIPTLWEIVAKQCPKISHEEKYCIIFE